MRPMTHPRGGEALRARNPEKEALELERDSAVRGAVEVLPERERRVIEERFFEGRTFRIVAVAIGLSPERIRQIQLKALRRLGSPRYGLVDFLDA